MSAFLWGAATSAHQVEGNNIHADWWEWERTTHHPQSGLACDHYQRFAADFALAKSLGHTAHRLSLEWSRIQFAPDQWSTKAIAHYRAVLQELKAQGLTSFVTLHHFTNPQWFAARGGWLQPDAVALFEQYVRVVVKELGDLVDYWITINEPNVYTLKGYWEGSWPPGHHSISEVWRVLRHLAAAHSVAYHVIHERLPEARVGAAINMTHFITTPEDSWLDRQVATWSNWWYNQRFLQQTAGTHDFIGVNYYFAAHKRWQWSPPFIKDVPLDVPRSDMNWPLYPQGLTQVLLGLTKHQLPVYITENGIANASDDHRSEFIRSHIRAVEKAQAQGVNVRGYLHWSLLDNFEWADGYDPKFGLVAVDFATQERTPRPSAYVYKAIITSSQSHV